MVKVFLTHDPDEFISLMGNGVVLIGATEETPLAMAMPRSVDEVVMLTRKGHEPPGLLELVELIVDEAVWPVRDRELAEELIREYDWS